MQNYVTDVEEIEPEAREIKYEQAIKFSRARKLIRVFAASAVLLDGLYSPFMLQTAPNGFEVMLNELGVDLSKEIKNYVKVIALPFVLCNLMNDLTAVDVMKEADDLALTFSQQSSLPEKQKKLIKTYIATLLLSITLKSLALLSSYPVGSSADAIPVADWIDDYFEEKTMPAIVLRFISLSVICGLETLFYIMFLNGRISQHANALVNTIKDFPSFVQNIIKHPLDFVEVLIQVSANAVNRGINLAFIMTDTLNAFFSLKPQSLFARDNEVMANSPQ